MKKRNQAVPRTFSKRRSRFSSLWGLDTVSKRKSSGHPSISQVQWQRRSSVQTQRVTPTSATHSTLPSVCVCVCVLPQVFVDGREPMKKPLERMFEDSASEKSVRAPLSRSLVCPSRRIPGSAAAGWIVSHKQNI